MLLYRWSCELAHVRFGGQSFQSYPTAETPRKDFFPGERDRFAPVLLFKLLSRQCKADDLHYMYLDIVA